jgi:hypothetical protein
MSYDPYDFERDEARSAWQAEGEPEREAPDPSEYEDRLDYDRVDEMTLDERVEFGQEIYDYLHRGDDMAPHHEIPDRSCGGFTPKGEIRQGLEWWAAPIAFLWVAGLGGWWFWIVEMFFRG